MSDPDDSPDDFGVRHRFAQGRGFVLPDLKQAERDIAALKEELLDYHWLLVKGHAWLKERGHYLHEVTPADVHAARLEAERVAQSRKDVQSIVAQYGETLRVLAD